MTPKGFVVDSWPVLEWLQSNDPAGRRFSDFLNREIADGSTLSISRINWGEIVYMLPKKLSGQRLIEAQAVSQRLPFTKISIDDDLVDAAAELKKHHACSFADCFAAALAMRTGFPLVTGDPEFLALEQAGLLRVKWLGA